MSRQNVELVRKAFDALRSDGIEASLGFVDPEGVWYTAPEWVEASEYHGHDGLRFLLSVWNDNFDDWTVDSLELREAGNSVVALFEHSGRIKGTDAPMRQPMGAVYSHIRDGKIGEARFFQSWNEALEAAGLVD
jgi:ketosteroid isomerase-like protein